MEGLSVDSTPTTEYRLSSFSNCSSPPVNDESSYGSSFLRVSSQDNCKEAGDMIECAACPLQTDVATVIPAHEP